MKLRFGGDRRSRPGRTVGMVEPTGGVRGAAPSGRVRSMVGGGTAGEALATGVTCRRSDSALPLFSSLSFASGRRRIPGDAERASGGRHRSGCVSVATRVFALQGGSAGAAFKTTRDLWGQDDARVRDTFLYRGLWPGTPDRAPSALVGRPRSVRCRVDGGSQLCALPLALCRSLIQLHTC